LRGEQQQWLIYVITHPITLSFDFWVVLHLSCTK